MFEENGVRKSILTLTDKSTELMRLFGDMSNDISSKGTVDVDDVFEEDRKEVIRQLAGGLVDATNAALANAGREEVLSGLEKGIKRAARGFVKDDS
jgi:hypothetical protein